MKLSERGREIECEIKGGDINRNRKGERERVCVHVCTCQQDIN